MTSKKRDQKKSDPVRLIFALRKLISSIEQKEKLAALIVYQSMLVRNAEIEVVAALTRTGVSSFYWNGQPDIKDIKRRGICDDTLDNYDEKKILKKARTMLARLEKARS